MVLEKSLIFLPLRSLILLSVTLTISSPSYKIEPEEIFPGGSGISFNIARELTDFPQPDSPYNSSVSPFFKFQDKLLTALIFLPLTKKSTLKFLTSNAKFVMTWQPGLIEAWHHLVYFLSCPSILFEF